MEALRESAHDIDAAGASIVAIAQGSPKQAQSLCDRFRVPFACVADPQKDGYKAFGLKRGTAMEVMGPATWSAGLRAFRKGHRIETPGDDVFQMPGTFIIDTSAVVRYARYARHSGDHPTTAELLAALAAMRDGGDR